jgi:hypothetical protein
VAFFSAPARRGRRDRGTAPRDAEKIALSLDLGARTVRVVSLGDDLPAGLNRGVRLTATYGQDRRNRETAMRSGRQQPTALNDQTSAPSCASLGGAPAVGAGSQRHRRGPP